MGTRIMPEVAELALQANHATRFRQELLELLARRFELEHAHAVSSANGIHCDVVDLVGDPEPFARAPLARVHCALAQWLLGGLKVRAAESRRGQSKGGCAAPQRDQSAGEARWWRASLTVTLDRMRHDARGCRIRARRA
jgi:hypothetical protein